MNTLVNAAALLPINDWAALAAFFAAWVAYDLWSERRATKRPSVLSLSNRERTRWMLQATRRDNRVLDGVVAQYLSSSPSFFASTTIFIIGGLMAALLRSDQASELVRELPFAARTTGVVFDIKLVVLAGIFVYAFFRFTWSLRQYSFGALLLAAAPNFDAWPSDIDRHAFAKRAGGVMGLAADSFNDGLRAYYMAFAVSAWFISPVAFMVGTVMVLVVLYRREFRSEVLAVLEQDHPLIQPSPIQPTPAPKTP